MQNPNAHPVARLSLFELAVLVLRHLPALVLIPIAFGIAMYGATQFMQRTYVSEAIVALPATNAGTTPQQAAALMISPLVLDPVIESMHLTPDLNRDQARGELMRRVKTSTGKDLLVRLEVQGKSPEEAQQTATAILNSWLKSTVPSERDQVDLKRRLAVATTGLESVQKALTQLVVENPISAGRREAGMSVVAIGELGDKYLDQTILVPRLMEGVPRESIKQQPTLPVQPIKPRKLFLATLATMISFFVLLAALALRQWLRSDPVRSAKLRRLAQALPGHRGEDRAGA